MIVERKHDNCLNYEIIVIVLRVKALFTLYIMGKFTSW